MIFYADKLYSRDNIIIIVSSRRLEYFVNVKTINNRERERNINIMYTSYLTFRFNFNYRYHTLRTFSKIVKIIKYNQFHNSYRFR